MKECQYCGLSFNSGSGHSGSGSGHSGSGSGHAPTLSPSAKGQRVSHVPTVSPTTRPPTLFGNVPSFEALLQRCNMSVGDVHVAADIAGAMNVLNRAGLDGDVAIRLAPSSATTHLPANFVVERLGNSSMCANNEGQARKTFGASCDKAKDDFSCELATCRGSHCEQAVPHLQLYCPSTCNRCLSKAGRKVLLDGGGQRISLGKYKFNINGPSMLCLYNVELYDGEVCWFIHCFLGPACRVAMHAERCDQHSWPRNFGLGIFNIEPNQGLPLTIHAAHGICPAHPY